MAKVTGGRQLSARIRRLADDRMIRAIGGALFVAGDMVKVDAQISITTGSVSGAGHVPSRPGDPPMNDTGDLVRGIENTQVGPLKVEVTSSSKHAVPLEFGTSRMSARPSMGPAAQKNRHEAAKLITTVVNRELRRTSS